MNETFVLSERISKAGFNFHFSGDLSESNFCESVFNFVSENLDATVKVHVSDGFTGDCDVFCRQRMVKREEEEDEKKNHEGIGSIYFMGNPIKLNYCL